MIVCVGLYHIRHGDNRFLPGYVAHIAIANNFMYVRWAPSVLLITSKTVSLRSRGRDADNDFEVETPDCIVL